MLVVLHLASGALMTRNRFRGDETQKKIPWSERWGGEKEKRERESKKRRECETK